MFASGSERQTIAARLASALPALPPIAQIEDNMLALMMNMAEATGTRAAFLLTPGGWRRLGMRMPFAAIEVRGGGDLGANSSINSSVCLVRRIPTLSRLKCRCRIK